MSFSGPRALTSGWSLRRKLVASILVLFVVVTLGTATATVLSLRRSVMGQLDAQVKQTISGPDLDNDGNSPPIRFQQNACSTGDVRGRPRGEGLVLYTVNGAEISGCVFTNNDTPTDLTDEQVTKLTSTSLSTQPSTIDLGGTLGEYRVMRYADSQGRALTTGLTQSRANETIRQAMLLTTAFGLIGLLIAGFGGVYLVTANLRPLRRVSEAATGVATLPLSSGRVSLAEAKLPAEDTDPRTEVGQVGAALNDLLDHVDASLAARHESEVQLRQFVADASHELRTPLASIKGYAELSRRERAPVPETITHALGRIEAESVRMTSLVEDLLLLARLDAGRPLAVEEVDLTMLTIDAVSDLRAASPDHVWKLDLPEEPVEVTGDRARLTQVMINLLGNARTHTPPGTVVVARVRQEGPYAVVEVEDNGPGIAKDLLPNIFGRFTRGDAARVRAAGSTGLGLSIVLAVTQAHRGAVGVSSDPGRTVFTLRLPLDGQPGTVETPAPPRVQPEPTS